MVGRRNVAAGRRQRAQAAVDGEGRASRGYQRTPARRRAHRHRRWGSATYERLGACSAPRCRRRPQRQRPAARPRRRYGLARRRPRSARRVCGTPTGNTSVCVATRNGEHARGAAHQTPCALKKAFEKAQQAQRCAAPAPAAPPRNLPTTRRIAAKTASKSAVRRRRRRQRRKLAVSRAGELTRAAVEYVDVRSSAGARDASDSPRLRTNALDAGEGDPTARWRHAKQRTRCRRAYAAPSPLSPGALLDSRRRLAAFRGYQPGVCMSAPAIG